MSHAVNSISQTLDQRRANHAWNVVKRARAKQEPHQGQDPKKFGGQAKKLPMRIMAAGLGQALAFLKAKDDAPGLLAELSDWLSRRMPPRDGGPCEILERIINGDSDFLRRTTDEALAYLTWLNRFAEAEGLTEEEEN